MSFNIFNIHLIDFQNITHVNIKKLQIKKNKTTKKLLKGGVSSFKFSVKFS